MPGDRNSKLSVHFHASRAIEQKRYSYREPFDHNFPVSPAWIKAAVPKKAAMYLAGDNTQFDLSLFRETRSGRIQEENTVSQKRRESGVCIDKLEDAVLPCCRSQLSCSIRLIFSATARLMK